MVAEAREVNRALGESRVTPQGTLRIATLSLLGELLTPLIAELLLRNPLLRVEVSLADAHVDLISEEYDVALQTGPLADSARVARRLGRLRTGDYASPAYLARQGRPRTSAELQGHACVVLAAPGRTRRTRHDDERHPAGRRALSTGGAGVIRARAGGLHRAPVGRSSTLCSVWCPTPRTGQGVRYRTTFHSRIILGPCCKAYTVRVSTHSPCESRRARVAPHLRSPHLVRGDSYPPRTVALLRASPFLSGAARTSTNAFVSTVQPSAGPGSRGIQRGVHAALGRLRWRRRRVAGWRS